MSGSRRGQPERTAHLLAALLRQAATRYAAQLHHRPAQQLLEQAARVAPRSARASRMRSVIAGLALAAAAAIAALWLAQGGGSDSLRYEIIGAARADSGYVIARTSSPSRLKFSDGSVVTLSGGGRLRVQAASSQAVTLVLERGVAEAQVTRRPDSRWDVLAGSFTIRVVGTRFRADWDSEMDRLTVEVQEGVVRIEGGPTGAGAEVSAGQRFRADARTGSFRIESPAAPPPAGSGKPGEPATSENSAPPAGDTALAGHSPSAAMASGHVAPEAVAGASWADMMAHGDFRALVGEAEQRGIDSCLTSCGSADLRRLADAARYTGRLALAERALGAVRSRSSGDAATAAYLLGAVNESRARGSRALHWYDTYLREAPTGAYRAEALLGRMRLLARSGRAQAARAAAKDYLAAYPGGVGAAAARRMLASP